MIDNKDININRDENKSGKSLFDYGSTWVRFDCHLHTKADSGNFYIEADYYEKYINNLKASEIKVGIITNHNKFDIEEFKELKKRAMKENIYLLAGVELTAKEGSNGIHILVCFNEKWHENKTNEDFIGRFLDSVSKGQSNFRTNNGKANTDLISTIETLEDYKKDGRDYFIILAHVNNDNGFFNELKGGLIQTIGKNNLFNDNVVAFQKNHISSNKKIEHLEKQFANVEGSDPKKIEEIGKGEKSYIKIGDFNFDAVRYALVFYEYRVSKDEHKPEKIFIKSVLFEGGKLNGEHILFSPYMNNLIGIRGSGKSSILESIRYALEIPFSDNSADESYGYKESLVDYVLGSGGKVTLKISGTFTNEYTIKKIHRHNTEVFNDSEPKKLINISIDSLLNKPLYFGQKDLSMFGIRNNFEKDLIKKLFGKRVEPYKGEITDKKNDIKIIIEKLNSYKNIEERKIEVKQKINELEINKKGFEKFKLESRLKEQRNFELDKIQIDKIKNEIADYFLKWGYFYNDNREALKTLSVPESLYNQNNFEELKQFIKNLTIKSEKIFEAISDFLKSKETLDAVVFKFNKKFDDKLEEFNKILREINIPKLKPEDFLQIERELEINQIKLKEIEKLSLKKENLQNELNSCLAELNELYIKEYNEVKTLLENVNKEEKLVKIDIEFKGCKKDFEEFLKKIFGGSGLRTDDYKKITEKLWDLTEYYKNNQSLKEILSEDRYYKFKEYFDSNLSECLTYKAPDKIKILYKGKELPHLSLGQRASALINFIISRHDNGIIIIDQPEDDLDNQTIYNELIKEILEQKDKIQLIFATHNANIPVLGDCEQITVCRYENDSIAIEQGSIDEEQIQHSIINVMEGGEDAFKKRNEAYKLWKH